jgi:hypothetical protein
MSLSSKPKKIKPKSTVQELRLFQSINHRGINTIKDKWVKTPQQGSEKMPSVSQHSCSSILSIEGWTLEMFDSEPISCDLKEQKKRQTMVFISFPILMSTKSLTISRAKITF